MSRGCWCKKDKDTCPVHVLLPWLLRLPPGATLFPGISPWGALRTMRRMLVILKVPDAGKYCVHDFRRGHALDLQLSGACLSGWLVPCTLRVRDVRVHTGATLWEILAAGEWRSPKFLAYLDMHRLRALVTFAMPPGFDRFLRRLEMDAVLQAHLEESDGE